MLSGFRKYGSIRDYELNALKDSDRLIGCVGIDGRNIGDSQGAAELGYWLGEPFWGKGYAREAVAAIMKYGFDALGLETIHALCEPLDTASQKVLLACGLKRAGAACELKAPARTGARRLPLFRASRMDTSPLQQ